MIYITHLVYVQPGHEDLFHEYENLVLPLLEKYGASVLIRFEPTPETIVEQTIDTPCEVHLLAFPSDDSLLGYMTDPGRVKYAYMREEAVQSALVIRGEII